MDTKIFINILIYSSGGTLVIVSGTDMNSVAKPVIILTKIEARVTIVNITHLESNTTSTQTREIL